MQKLEYLLKLTQSELKVEVYNYLRHQNMNPIYEDGFVYAAGDIPILLVAHLDTVFEYLPKKIQYNEIEDKIFNSKGGLGGDDRCGVYAIMKILKKYRPHVLFTEDEEIGCIGAKKTVRMLPKPKVKFIIELDRKGSNDCVFYDCRNDEFINYIESFGFKTAVGSFSDISILGSEWDIAAVNLSSGYYHEHTKKEYIKFGELQNNIKRVSLILKDYEKVPYFDYQEISHRFKNIDNGLDDDWLGWFVRNYEFKNGYLQQIYQPEQNSKEQLLLKKAKKTNGKK